VRDKLDRWTFDRLFCFPELYEEERAEYMKGRARQLYHAAKGSAYDLRVAPNVTVAMCEATVASLDAHRADWHYTVFHRWPDPDTFEAIFLGGLALKHQEAFRKSEANEYKRRFPDANSKIFVPSPKPMTGARRVALATDAKSWWQFWK